MAIKVGDKLPSVKLKTMTKDGMKEMTTDEIFKGKDQKVEDKVLMLADGNADFTKAVGLEMDGTGFGMGMRSKRYAMVVENGVVKHLAVENPGQFEVSSAEAVMKAL